MATPWRPRAAKASWSGTSIDADFADRPWRKGANGRPDRHPDRPAETFARPNPAGFCFLIAVDERMTFSWTRIVVRRLDFSHALFDHRGSHPGGPRRESAEDAAGERRRRHEEPPRAVRAGRRDDVRADQRRLRRAGSVGSA